MSLYPTLTPRLCDAFVSPLNGANLLKNTKNGRVRMGAVIGLRMSSKTGRIQNRAPLGRAFDEVMLARAEAQQARPQSAESC